MTRKVRIQGSGSETRGARLTQRRLTLTPAALLERRTDTYEVAERRQLQAAAALVRFQNDPQLLGVEWTDGMPASEYKIAARDDLLAALLNATQVCVLASANEEALCFRAKQCANSYARAGCPES